MTDAEFTALGQQLSNEARCLYCLMLRPGANQAGQSAPLNYKHIKSLLNARKEVITLGRQINALLNELANVGLIGFADSADAQHSLNGKHVILPMLATEQENYTTLHLRHQAMHADWQPHTGLFSQLATLVGLLDRKFTEQECGEFVAYWLGRPGSHFSLFQWTQKFVQHLKKSRLAGGYNDRQRIGNQLVTKTVGVTADDNARKLVEKYRAKSE